MFDGTFSKCEKMTGKGGCSVSGNGT